MRVKMLVNTSYRGAKKQGEEYEVPAEVAGRWVNNGIAELCAVHFVEPEIEGQIDIEEIEIEEELEVGTDLMKLSAKKLYSMCVEQGLEIEPKKSKEYYIDMLSSL